MAVDDIELTPRRIIYMIIVMVAVPLSVLFLSGDWLWPEGWIFAAWYVILEAVTLIYLYLHDPGLLAERYRRLGTGGQKKWDKYFLLIFALAYLAWLMVIPLDAKRYGWTAGFPLWMKAAGSIALLVSAILLYRSFTDNPFLSPVVRIQKERHHRVISTGVYRLVRHPMYMGAILMFLGAPMLLGSAYGILIGMAMALLLVLRIVGEEKMLAEELEGYRAYQQKVKYRLIPFVW